MNGILLFISGIGPWEILIILVVVLVLFGGRKIPQLAKDLGSGIREFRKSMSGAAQDLPDHEEEEPKPRSTRKKKT